MKQHDIQLDSDGKLRHFLTIEGLKKQKIAQQSLESTIPFLDAYLVIPNEKIFGLVKGGTFQ